MDNKKIEKLTVVLERLNKEGVTEEIRKEALKLVAEVNPLELSIAEQNLIEKGMKPQDLRHLCDIHMEVLKGELDKVKSKLEPGHVVYTFISEHDKILEFLTRLEEINTKLQKADNYKDNIENIEELKYVIEKILDAENHHQREERVLFEEMESRKITGPTRIMRMEHEDLRAKKRLILNLAVNAENLDFQDFKLQLKDATEYLIYNLRDHIFKENYILYPTAVEAIKDKAVWLEMKKACDEIGYCSFTTL